MPLEPGDDRLRGLVVAAARPYRTEDLEHTVYQRKWIVIWGIQLSVPDDLESVEAMLIGASPPIYSSKEIELQRGEE
jgi:hypothetical protein